ncbi:hypothetical protein GCM10028794_19110 [Silanimonas algicola]
MALTKCKECGGTLSTNATACPHCGAKIVRTSGCTKVVAVLLALLFIPVMLVTCIAGSDRAPSRPPPTPQKAAQAAEQALAKAEAEQKAREEALATWAYSTGGDAMSGGTFRTAVLRSRNTFRLGFPYEGEQRGALTVRKHPRYGQDVILQIERGQMLCRIGGCNYSVKFDDGAIQQFTMNEPESHDSTVLFFANQARFLSQMKRAKLVRIEVPLFQHAPLTLEFDVSSFDEARWLEAPPRAAQDGS